jgi:sodium/potassium/calcium exchanger 6
MSTMVSLSEHKRRVLFLNISFLLVACTFLIVQFNSAEFLVLRSAEPFKDNGQEDCQDWLI